MGYVVFISTVEVQLVTIATHSRAVSVAITSDSDFFSLETSIYEILNMTLMQHYSYNIQRRKVRYKCGRSLILLFCLLQLHTTQFWDQILLTKPKTLLVRPSILLF